jgi:phospholipase C
MPTLLLTASISGALDDKKENIKLQFLALGNLPKTKTIGVPFQVYTALPYQDDLLPGKNWSFTVCENESLSYEFPLADFAGKYHLKAHGPNGFYNEFKGSAKDPKLLMETRSPEKLTLFNQLELLFCSGSYTKLKIKLHDRGYKPPIRTIVLDN